MRTVEVLQDGARVMASVGNPSSGAICSLFICLPSAGWQMPIRSLGGYGDDRRGSLYARLGY